MGVNISLKRIIDLESPDVEIVSFIKLFKNRLMFGNDIAVITPKYAANSKVFKPISRTLDMGHFGMSG
jgi:hypothetical protein